MLADMLEAGKELTAGSDIKRREGEIKGMITKEDAQVISKIVKRAKDLGVKRSSGDLSMDMQAAHEKCPLRLEELLKAENYNFLHDVIGIVNHLDRETGELEDYFVPRYAR
jgi:hypothetical protein